MQFESATVDLYEEILVGSWIVGSTETRRAQRFGLTGFTRLSGLTWRNLRYSPYP